MKSMTGFGSARMTSGAEEVLVELKSVNHKFLEVKARMPREASALEASVVKSVRDGIERGSVEVSVRRMVKSASGVLPVADLALAQAYRKVFAQLAESLGVPDDTSVRSLASLPNVIRVEEPSVDLTAFQEAMQSAVKEALSAFIAMRSAEGEVLRRDLASRLGLIEQLASEIQSHAPASVEALETRLRERLGQLTKSISVDESRLAQEVALFAERIDVAEEMTRLKSHFEQFRALLTASEPVGRKMDFLVQEMNREVNTTGSKSQSIEISNRVVALKAELERVREQIQNVE
jgi:uncharacterized protein (TIGR00255 family)